MIRPNAKVELCSLSSQVISDPKVLPDCKRSVCQGTRSRHHFPPASLSFPSDKAVRQPWPCTLHQSLRLTHPWRQPNALVRKRAEMR